MKPLSRKIRFNYDFRDIMFRNLKEMKPLNVNFVNCTIIKLVNNKFTEWNQKYPIYQIFLIVQFLGKIVFLYIIIFILIII